MLRTVDLLTALIRCAVTGESACGIEGAEDSFDKIINLARQHDIAHLAAYVMIRDGLLSDETKLKTAQKLTFEASYRDTKNRYTYELTKKTLNGAKIPFVPLKGAVIRQFYPESWMRSSCDTDILVKKQDFEKAFSLFKDIGFVLDGDRNYHDVSLIYDDSNLELHFSICENMKGIDSQLKKVWDNIEKQEDFMYLETHDYFVFHHIAHMAYHLLAGGCGIRPFLDFWILNRNDFFDDEAVSEFCKSAKIYDFYLCVKQLADAWFEGREHTELTKRLEKYVLSGGTYGHFPNNAAAYTVRNGGKVKYLLKLAMPPYSNMKVMYPTLNRAPFLLPYFYLYRIFQKTLGRNSGEAKRKYSIIKEQDSAFIREVSDLIKALKLDK